MKKIASAFFIASIGGLTALGLNHFLHNSTKNHPLANYITTPTPIHYAKLAGNAVENTTDFTTAADLTVHSVVNVKTTYPMNYSNQYYDPFRDFFGQRQPRQQEAPSSTGSGIIISQDGYIVTNNHVIDNGEKIEITLNDKRTYTADLIGKDPTTDLALLKIKETQSSIYKLRKLRQCKSWVNGFWLLVIPLI
jgi:serine protease Do